MEKIAKFEKVSFEQFLEGLEKNMPDLAENAQQIYDELYYQKERLKVLLDMISSHHLHLILNQENKS